MIKKRYTVMILTAGLILVGFLPLSAALDSISFQGQLLDSSGEPASSPQDIVFKIYTAAIGGTALVTITKNAVKIEDNGLYNVELDVSGISDWNQDLYLGITVGSDNEMEPRIKILPSASAIYAVSAGSADSADSIEWLKITGRPEGLDDGDQVSTITATANTIGSYHIINATITAADIADGAITDAKLALSYASDLDIAAATTSAVGPYLTKSSASATYLQSADMSSYATDTEVADATTSAAVGPYLLKSSAPATYLQLSSAAVTYLYKTGGTMSGNLDMGNHQVTLSTITTSGSEVRIATHTVISGTVQLNWDTI